MTALSKEQLAEIREFAARDDIAYMPHTARHYLVQLLRHIDAPAPAVTWVEWKPGDAMPDGLDRYSEYLTTRKGHHGNPFLWVCLGCDFDDLTLAYDPRPLAPYAAPAREKV